MLPGVFEFRWDLGHVIFLGAFYSVVTVIGITLAVGGRRAWRSLFFLHVDHVRWHEEFEELPASARACRHALSGRFPGRQCEHGFDCGACLEHPVIAKWESKVQLSGTELACTRDSVRPGRLHHRGHTWVEKLDNGNVRLGLDNLARLLIGAWDSVELPEVGTHLEVNGTAWTVVKGGARLRILAPVAGEVVASAAGEIAGYLEVKLAAPARLEHLLDDKEAPAWLASELERLASMPDCAPLAEAAKRGDRQPGAACAPDGLRLAWRLLLLTEP